MGIFFSVKLLCLIWTIEAARRLLVENDFGNGSSAYIVALEKLTPGNSLNSRLFGRGRETDLILLDDLLGHLA